MDQEWAVTDAKNMREDELDKLFSTAKKLGARPHLMMILGYNGAFRVSELIHLRTTDFNWHTGKVRLIPLKKAGKRRKKNPDGTTTMIDKPLPKPVEYPLPKVAMATTREYIKNQKLGVDNWLFPGNTGKNGCHIVKLECPGGHISKRKVQMIFDEIAVLARVKVPGRGIHSLKHGRLTEVAEKSRDPYFVKQVGRHSSIVLSDKYVQYVNFSSKIDEIGGRT